MDRDSGFQAFIIHGADERPDKEGGGFVEAVSRQLAMVGLPGKRPWLGCCRQGSALIESTCAV
jgi:hypothetical protein